MEIKSMLKSIKEDKLIFAEFISALLYSIGIPGMNIATYSNMDSRTLSILNSIGTVTGIIIPIIWVKYGKKIFKYTALLTYVEMVSYILLAILLILDIINPHIWFIVEKIAISTVTRNLSSACLMIHSDIYNTKEKRYTFDSVCNAVIPIGTLIGYLINIIIPVSEKLSFIIFVIGVNIFDICYLYVIKKTYN